MRVECEIEETELDNEEGGTVDGVRARCPRCDHETESFGTHERSINRCLVLLREECPRGEKNFYLAE